MSQHSKKTMKKLDNAVDQVIATITLGPDGASESKKSVEFKTLFAPTIIKVDGEVRMLQLRRKLAEWKQ